MNRALHWKIQRDPYFRKLGEAHGEAAVYEAGFFLDESTVDAPLDDVQWLCTPHPARGSIGHASKKSKIVLLSTGAFDPIHDGHIELMEKARQAMIARGYDVVRGYVSPGHDAYVQMKCGELAMPASVRLDRCAQKIAASESARHWLSVDPWEALHRNVAVNFTDVVARLRNYLRYHFDRSVDVFYVCGGDNARFAHAFVSDGGCVVVGRPGAEAEFSVWHRRLAGHPQIVFVEGNHPAASRTLRKEGLRDDRKTKVVVRLENEYVLRSLLQAQLHRECKTRLSATWLSEFQQAFLRELNKCMQVRTQQVGCNTPAFANNTISLDALLPARYNIAISRLFELGGYSQIGYSPRPHAPPFETQIATLPAGDYVLHDDDCVTGGTVAAVKRLLPNTVGILCVDTSVGRSTDEEVIDCRDFLLGADDGGLVVQLSSGKARMPYVLPYVDPFARASIPPSHAREFSRAVWQLNESMFTGTSLCIADLPAPARAAFMFLDQSTELTEVCRWHIERLE